MTAVNTVWVDLFGILKALLLLIAAFLVAAAVKNIVLRIIERSRLNAWLLRADGERQRPGTTREYIGKLVYFLVFLLFVPGIFELIGASSITTPILGLLNRVWGYIPNLLASIIILIVGLLIARLVRQLLVPVFARLRVDRLQEKAGLEVRDAAKLSSTLAYIIYVLIVIPVVIMALQALKIDAVTQPAISMLNIIFAFIPSIIVGILVIVIGVMIGNFAGQIVERLIAATGVDAKLSGQLEGDGTKKPALSRVVGVTVQIVIILLFSVEGFDVLKLGILTDVGGAIIAYMPRALAAVMIFALAAYAATAVGKMLKNSGLSSYALIARIAIYTVGAFMILNQLGIAAIIVNSAFILILAAIAVAFAIAFGIGGRDAAAETLKKLREKKDNK